MPGNFADSMRTLILLNLCLTGIAPLGAFSILLALGLTAQSQSPPGSQGEDSVRRFLQDYTKNSDHNKTTRYFSAIVNLKDDGTREFVVYLTGNVWCGSGGCTTLILAPKGSSYQIVTRITIARPPIRILTSRTNGWHDIGVWVQGGGVQRGYEAELSFDGQSYPNNPSISPARRLRQEVAGEVVVPSTAEGAPVYQ